MTDYFSDHHRAAHKLCCERRYACPWNLQYIVNAACHYHVANKDCEPGRLTAIDKPVLTLAELESQKLQELEVKRQAKRTSVLLGQANYGLSVDFCKKILRLHHRHSGLSSQKIALLLEQETGITVNGKTVNNIRTLRTRNARQAHQELNGENSN